MKRVTIYVDEAIWEDIKDSSWMARLSIGNYLVKLHEAKVREIAELRKNKEGIHDTVK